MTSNSTRFLSVLPLLAFAGLAAAQTGRTEKLVAFEKIRVHGRSPGDVNLNAQAAQGSRSKSAFMPIYEYRCQACAHEFEYLIRSSSPAAKCPLCESSNLEQLISGAAVHSESAHQANLSAAHRKVAAARGERQREDHRSQHEHFEDPAQRKQGT
jgi:putative FmdB family regulatory protein